MKAFVRCVGSILTDACCMFFGVQCISPAIQTISQSFSSGGIGRINDEFKKRREEHLKELFLEKTYNHPASSSRTTKHQQTRVTAPFLP